MTKQEVEKKSFELIRELRRQLALVDVADLEEKEESEQDRRDYCAAIFAVYPRLEKDIKKFLNLQADFMLNKAEIWEQVILGRGSFSSPEVLLSKWKTAAGEHEANSKPEGKFDKTNPLGEV